MLHIVEGSSALVFTVAMSRFGSQSCVAHSSNRSDSSSSSLLILTETEQTLVESGIGSDKELAVGLSLTVFDFCNVGQRFDCILSEFLGSFGEQQK